MKEETKANTSTRLADRITKGENFIVDKESNGQLWVTDEGSTYPLLQICQGEERNGQMVIEPQNQADAELIAEVFTVTNESGLSPKELLEQRNELLEALTNALRELKAASANPELAEKQDAEDYAFQGVIESAEAAIKKVKP